jgi:adenylosuccinate synthase
MKAVIGLGFGDEGKGVTTDWLADTCKPDMIVRFSGGHQAGHNVVIGDTQHVFSNFGAGTLRGIPTYWESTCTIDPVGIKCEYDVLKSKGITPTLYINNACPITTPFDKLQNNSSHDTMGHGSCGVGFFETLKRERALFSVTAMDIKYPKVMDIKLQSSVVNYYDPMSVTDPTEFIDCVEWMRTCEDINIVPGMHNTNVVYEGSQGLLLDQNIGIFPHCTPSNTGSKFFRDRDLNPHYYLITRAYQTRHGNGFMSDHGNFKPLDNKHEQNFDDGPQGEFRKSMLDLEFLKYGMEKDGGFNAGNSTLVVTCFEHMPELVYWDGTRERKFDSEYDFSKSLAHDLGLKAVTMFRNHLNITAGV